MFVQLSHAYTWTGIVPESPASRPANTVIRVPPMRSVLPRCDGDSIVRTGAAWSLSPVAVAFAVAADGPLRFAARTWKVHDVPSPQSAMYDGVVLFVGAHARKVEPPFVDRRYS